jgi:predicted MFS family arabinose efflux permease
VARSETSRLLRRPGFARYFAVVASSRATGTMFNVAGVLLILQRTHDLALAGTVVAATSLPGALTGPFLGGWLDVARSRRRLLVLDRLLTAGALAAILALAGHAPNWTLPLAALAYGLTSPLSSGAYAAVLPEIAGPGLLDAANAFEAASVNVAFIVGPALAGGIAAAAGPAAAIEVQLVAGLVLAVLIASDATFELRPEHGEARPERVLSTVREGLAVTWRTPPLRWNIVIDLFYVLAWSTLYVSFPAFGLALGAGAHSSGYMWAAVAAGSMVGGFAIRQRAGGRSQGAFIGICFAAMAVSGAFWPLAGTLAVALALIFVTGVLDGPGLVGLISIRQRLTPPRLRGAVFTTATSMHSAEVAAGAAGAGLFHRAFGTTATLLCFPALIAAAAAIALLSQHEEGPRTAIAPAVAEPAGPAHQRGAGR